MAENVLLVEQTIEGFAYGSDTGSYAVGQPATFELVAGQNYKVLWDGSEYSCTAYAFNMGQFVGVGIGNEGAMTGASADIVEPFAIMYIQSTNYNTFAVMDGSTKTSHDVGIYQVVEEDKEYLIWGSTLKGIADAIREKTGGTVDINPVDMPTEIRSIIGGGSSDADLVYVKFMSHDGTTELYKRAVVRGNDCMEIVAGGLIDAPTKESTASQVFTFAGWSTVANGGLDENALKNVTEDRTVYANYIATTRVYAVRFFDGDTQVGDTQYLAYGSTPTTDIPEKDGYIFDGWSPAVSAVTSDISYYAQWTSLDEYAAHGDCGDGVIWTLTYGGLLTISGAGAMEDYSNYPNTPFYEHRNAIKEVVIRDGITHIGDCALAGGGNVPMCYTSVEIPDSVKSIGNKAFMNATSLTDITLPEGLTEIAGFCFVNCTLLTSINIPRTVQAILNSAFYYTGLTSVTIPAAVDTIEPLAFAGAPLTSATFETTSGWMAGDTALNASDLANTETAATYLKTTYMGKKWTRS